MARVLVTGGAGFIGSHVAEALIAARPRGHRARRSVRRLHRQRAGSGALRRRQHHRRARRSTACSPHGRFDYVYHLAAYAAEGLSHFIRRFNYTNNLIGSVNLINASVNTGVKGFVFTLVDRRLRRRARADAARTRTPQPRGSLRHRQVRGRAGPARLPRDMFGLRYVIFRPHNVYGPRQNIGDRYRNVVGIFMNQILQGRPMTIFGDGTQTRAFSYIDDVAPVMAEAIESSGRVGSGVQHRRRPAVHAQRAGGGGGPRDGRRAAHRAPAGARTRCRTRTRRTTALAAVFGARPTTPLDDGLRRWRRG